MKDEQFHAERLVGVGASEVAGLKNIGWGCRRKMWYSKRQVIPDFPQQETPAMRRGTLLEPIVLQLAHEAEGFLPAPDGTELYRTKGRMLVHYDAIVTEWESDDLLPVECKTANHRTMRKFIKEGLPEQYILQVQQEIEVLGAKRGYIHVLCPEPWSDHGFWIERDDEIIKWLHVAVDTFWAQVENGPGPDPLPLPDHRCSTCPWRHTCQGERILHAVDPKPDDGTEPETDLTLGPLVERIHEAQDIADDASDYLQSLKDELKEQTAGRPSILTGNAKILTYTTVPERWDTKALNSLVGTEQGTFLVRYKRPGAPVTTQRIFYAAAP